MFTMADWEQLFPLTDWKQLFPIALSEQATLANHASLAQEKQGHEYIPCSPGLPGGGSKQ